MLLARIDSASSSIRFVERNLLNVKQIVHEGWIDCIDIPIAPVISHQERFELALMVEVRTPNNGHARDPERMGRRDQPQLAMAFIQNPWARYLR